MNELRSECCGAKIFMMFPTGADNQDEKLPDICSKCYKPIKIKEKRRQSNGITTI